MYFSIPLFVHVVYIYINQIDWYTCGNGEQYNHIKVVFLLPPDNTKITYREEKGTDESHVMHSMQLNIFNHNN